MSLVRQHLIDPEICIRCNTCEETCPTHAITHDSNNYVVQFETCNWCGDCFTPCPTGAINGIRMVAHPWTIGDQYTWDTLPRDTQPEGGASAVPVEVEAITAIASAGTGGKLVAPASAPKTVINLFTPDAPVIATVTGNMRLTDPGAASDIRHVVLDFGATVFPVVEGQSIGVIAPGVDANGRAHLLRLYSVASPRDGERPGFNNLALTVKRVVVEENGATRRGVASNYVCDLQRGDQVKITGPYGTTFLMPDAPDANLIMICTGTGSAPFRAMTERRRRHMKDTPGKILLFFGARSRGELPYFGPLMKLPKSLIDVELALSREPRLAKRYVQDAMRERAADVARLLEDANTFVYICGLKGMEDGCRDSLVDICRSHGMEWEKLAPRLRAEGRFHVETY